MPIQDYGVLKARVHDFILAGDPRGDDNHYEVHAIAGEDDYQLAINVRSDDGSLVEYVVDSRFRHPILQELHEKPLGFHALQSQAGGLALDYIRGELVASPQEKFVPLPISAPGADNDLNDKIDQYVQRALRDPSAFVYAFGARFRNQGKNKYFRFSPDMGIHDIHENQGNGEGRFKKYNGVWQDGGLIFEFPREEQFVAVFLRFQTQAWHTDDQTGDPIEGKKDDLRVRIIAALVNGEEQPKEREYVTLLNVTRDPIDLDGWSLLDKAQRATPLSGNLPPGETVRVPLKPPMELVNKGGTISLLNQEKLKVDGVSYTKEQAAKEGWTIKF